MFRNTTENEVFSGATMTREYLQKRIEFAIYKEFSLMRVELPIKTGRLQYRAFKLEETADGWRLYIDLYITVCGLFRR